MPCSIAVRGKPGDVMQRATEYHRWCSAPQLSRWRRLPCSWRNGPGTPCTSCMRPAVHVPQHRKRTYGHRRFTMLPYPTGSQHAAVAAASATAAAPHQEHSPSPLHTAALLHSYLPCVQLPAHSMRITACLARIGRRRDGVHHAGCVCCRCMCHRWQPINCKRACACRRPTS